MRGKENTNSLSVPEAKPSSAAASHFGFQLRKNKQRRRIVTGTSVSCKGVAGAPEPTRHLFIKRITKDTENDAVKNIYKIMALASGIFDVYPIQRHVSSLSNCQYQHQNSRDFLMKNCGERVWL